MTPYPPRPWCGYLLMVAATLLPFYPYAVLRFRTEESTLRIEMAAWAFFAWFLQIVVLRYFLKQQRGPRREAILNIVTTPFVPIQLVCYHYAVFPMQTLWGVWWAFISIGISLLLWAWENYVFFIRRDMTWERVYVSAITIESIAAAILFLRWIAGYR